MSLASTSKHNDRGPAVPALRPLLVLTNSGRENPTLLRIGEDLVQVGLRLQEAGLDGLVAVEDGVEVLL